MFWSQHKGYGGQGYKNEDNRDNRRNHAGRYTRENLGDGRALSSSVDGNRDSVSTFKDAPRNPRRRNYVAGYGTESSSCCHCGKDPFSKKDYEAERYEIKAALLLLATFKKEPDLAELEKLPGYFSFERGYGSKPYGTLMFKDIESLETAKSVLNGKKMLKSTEYAGLRAPIRRGNPVNFKRIFVRFEEPCSKEEVIKLDDRIKKVIPLNKDSFTVEFYTIEDACSAAIKLQSNLNQYGLIKLTTNAIKQAKKQENRNHLLNSNTHKDQVVLRDVPKSVKLKEFSVHFPDAVSFTLFDKTFPASDYCHAAVRFNNTERVKEVLELKDLEIAGKKVYIFPAFSQLLHEYPELGVKECLDETEKDTKPSIKRKLEEEAVKLVEAPEKAQYIDKAQEDGDTCSKKRKSVKEAVETEIFDKQAEEDERGNDEEENSVEEADEEDDEENDLLNKFHSF